MPERPGTFTYPGENGKRQLHRFNEMQAISLFSGCGGCSLGLKDAGFTVRLAADNDANACATYTQNLGVNPWCVDLDTVSPEELLERAGLSRGKLDLLVGGPPCQGFSSAGAKDWQDPRNSLLRKFVEYVEVLKPTWFVMENVEGLFTSNQGFYFTEAIARYLEAGYTVGAKKVYMEEHGIPQRRKRVFVVGNLEGVEFRFPDVTHYSPGQGRLIEVEKQRTILDAISDLPTPTEAGFVKYESQPLNQFQATMRRTDGQPVSLHKVKPTNAQTVERIAALRQGQTMKDLPPDLQHPSFQRRAFRRVMDGTPTEKRGGAPSGLKRLLAKEPSLTVTSAAPTEFIHPNENRLLTIRECARIQTFPDWFEFSGTWNSFTVQIGNAIPPAFMRLLAEQIQQSASWKPKRQTIGRWLGISATKADAMSPALAAMLNDLEKKTYAFAQ